MRIVMVIAAVIVAACNSSPATAPANDQFTVRVGQSIGISNTGLRIKFIRVTHDSRCPSNVDCIWAGNGQIELELRGSGMVDTMTLNTFEGAKEGVAGAYRIRFVALAPTPITTDPIEPDEYRATLLVVPVGTVCTEEARPGLSVAITDSLAPNTLLFANVSVVARDGAYADSVFYAAYPAGVYTGPIALAYERRGTYTVTVRADGYSPWSKTGIEVAGDVCHVVTVGVSARLARP